MHTASKALCDRERMGSQEEAWLSKRKEYALLGNTKDRLIRILVNQSLRATKRRLNWVGFSRWPNPHI